MKQLLRSNQELCFYFHLIPPDDPSRLLIIAGSGKIHDFPTVLIPHRLFFYLLDTLRWIPTRAGTIGRIPFEKPIIALEGAATALLIFSGWRHLFSAAGEEVILTSPGISAMKTFSLPRDDLVATLSSLEQFATEVAEGNKVIYCSDIKDYRRQVSK